MKRILILLLLIGCDSLSAAYQLVDHPRMFVTKATLPILAERAYGNGTIAGDYALMKQEAEYFVQRGVLKQPTSQWHPPYELICCGLVYLVERERGNPEADKYARAVVNFWGNGLILSNVGNMHFGYYGLVFDWIYDAMTQEERNKFGYHLGGWLYYYTNTPEITLQNGDWLYNQTWGPSHLNIGNTRDGITPKLFVALALAGADTSNGVACTRFLNSFDSRVPLECIPRFDLMGGVWSESYGHGSYGPTRVIAWAFEAWRTATGQNLFELGEPDTYLKELNDWAVHLNVPFSNRTAYIDDNDGAAFFEGWVQTAPFIASNYQDPVARWCSERYNRGSWTDRWRTYAWQRIVSDNPEIQPLSPGQAGWNTSQFFKGAGHVYMRSRWDDPNATWAFFGAGPKLAAHSRDDEGHFLIANRGWLVLRAGGMGHNDSDYYSGGSLCYNIVTIFDPNEEFRRLAPSDQALASGGTKNERDGGLIRHVYGGNHSDVTARGEIKAFKHDWRYTYSAADMTKGYTFSKINEVTRQFLYLRGEKEYFILFDRVDSRNAAFPKTWFLHIPTEPTVNGNETVLTAEHVFSYSDANYCTWISDPAGISEVYSTGKSRAHLTTILPDTFTITKRGGAGHEFWGHPHEPTAQYNHAGSEANRAPQVPWRLEVEAGAQTGRDFFLHVLEITDESVIAHAALARIDGESGVTGVRIEPAGGGEPIEVRFSTEGEMGAEIRFGDEIEQMPSAVDTTIKVGSRGDFNGDGRLSVADVLGMLLFGRTDPQREKCDFNGDGTFTFADVTDLIAYLRQRMEYPALAGVQ